MSGRLHVRSAPIPLFSLRPDLEAGWPLSSNWVKPVASDGPASLEHPSGTTVAFRLRHFSGSRLRSRVSLASRPGRTPTGAVRAKVLLRTGNRQQQLWQGVIGAIRPLPHTSLSLDLELPDLGEEADLLLCASPLHPRHDPAVRVHWETPTLEQPGSSSDPPPDEVEELEATSRRAEASELLISILTPVHDPPPQLLKETLESVHSQTYRDWELCLVDDGSSDEEVIRILDRAAAEDPRVRLRRHPEPGGISAATNSALEMAGGDFVALLDHDDLLHPEALELVAARLAENPELDMVYTDEEMIEGEKRVAHFLKPNWSPDLMRSHMYTCHLGVYRRTVAEEIGGFRPEFDGSQDYDFVLRLSERTERIAHLPRTLYQWRAHAGSAADNFAAKPHAYSAARRAIADHLRRTEKGAAAHFGPLRSWYQVEPDQKGIGPVSLILAAPELTRPLHETIAALGESWLRGETPELELVIAAPPASADDWARALRHPVGERLRVIVIGENGSKAARMNRAVEASEGRELLLLDTPLEALTTNAALRLASFVRRPGVGIVAPKVLTCNGRIQSIGAIVRDGLPVPVQLGADQIEQGPLAVLQVSANFGAVTGTIALSRQLFERLGGLEEELDDLAAADLCLRAWREGLRIVSTPETVLRHLPGAPPPVNDLAELSNFRARWLPHLPADPYYGGNLAMVMTGVAPC